MKKFTPLLFLALCLTAPAPAFSQQVLGGQNLNGKAPVSSIGNEQAWYIDFASGNLWGPKAFGTWPGSALGTFALLGTAQNFTQPTLFSYAGSASTPTIQIGAANYGLFQSANQITTSIAGTQSVIFGNVAGWASISSPTGQFLGLNAATGQPGVLAVGGVAGHYWNGTQIYPATNNTGSIGTSGSIYNAVYATTFYGGSAVAGVTCSGAPTSSFASTGGIVTHC